MTGSADLRPLTETDLPVVHAITKQAGLTAQNLADWLDWASWAIVENPYRGGAPVGWGVDHGGKLDGAVLAVRVPAKIGSWTGIAPMPFCLCAGSVPLGGLRLLAPFLNTQSLWPHTNSFGVKLLKRKQGVPVPGSEVSVTGQVSLWNRLLCRARGGAPRIAEAMSFDRQLARLGAEAVDELATRHLATADIAVIKDSAYLAWRYGKRGSQFGIIAVPSADGLDGLAVMQWLHDGGCRVMEMLYRPERIASVVDTILDETRRHGIGMVFARLGDMALAPHWQKHGCKLNKRAYTQFWAMPNGIPLAQTPMGCYSHGDHTFE